MHVIVLFAAFTAGGVADGVGLGLGAGAACINLTLIVGAEYPNPAALK